MIAKVFCGCTFIPLPDGLVLKYLELFIDLFFSFMFCRDVTISFSGKKIRAHKVILAARSSKWSSGDLADQTEIELEGNVSLENVTILFSMFLKSILCIFISKIIHTNMS